MRRATHDRLPDLSFARPWVLGIALAVMLGAGCAQDSQSRVASNGTSRPWFQNPFARRDTVPPAPAGYPAGVSAPRGRLEDPFLPAGGAARDPLPPSNPKSTSLPPASQGPGKTVGSRSATGLIDGLALVAAKQDVWAERFASFAADPQAITHPGASPRHFRYLVLYQSGASGGQLSDIEKQHRATLGLESCGYHFVIGTDQNAGLVSPTPRWHRQEPAAAVSGVVANRYIHDGIAICLTGDFNRQTPTTRQLEATRLLVDYLSEAYAIPPYRVLTAVEAAQSQQPSDVLPGPLLRIDSLLPAGR